MNEHKQYGFNPDLIKIKPEDYKFGALPFEILVENGQWDNFLPLYEPQADKYETWGCTIWGSQNQVEIYFKKVFGFEPNYNEIFNYIKAKVKMGGANPQNAYESIRKDGLINQELIPFPNTFEELQNTKVNSFNSKGKEWISNYEFSHEWIEKPTKNAIKEMLRTSPVAIGVTAWFEEDGFYVDKGLPNSHWCVTYSWENTKYGIALKVFDSYDHSTKLLHPDHNISVAKRIYIKKKEKIEEYENKDYWFMQILKRIFNLISPLVHYLKDWLDGKPLGGLRSPKWNEVRRNFTKKYPNCAVCGKNKDIQVHHRKPFHLHPELELLESNLISLCSDHHLFVGHLMNYHSFNEKVEEDAKIWFNKIQTRP